MPHSQTPPLYTSKQLAPALLPNLVPISPSLQSAAAAKAPLEVTAEALAEAPPPVSTVDWERIKTFRKKLQQEAIETYSRCNKRWFQIHLATQGDNISVCKACIRDTNSLKYPSEPFLFSDANNMDPGAVPKYLPTLTEVEGSKGTCLHYQFPIVLAFALTVHKS